MSRSENIGLFGTRTRSATLLVIHLLRETHAAEIARVLEVSLSQAQGVLASLEIEGAVVGVREGVARRVRLNPRYFFFEELKVLLDKMGLHDITLGEKLGTIRHRPRRAGKEL